ncbi:hypothetical protein [uncultured Nitratireductor sp.]|uniref:hypothetical protein n=1 Tax=uncultured Nitratireductor sp. TaxID=520953 RepID=UPI0025FE2A7D|nr:hypothetical protein [uncultured Nitratireductor sp.]
MSISWNEIVAIYQSQPWWAWPLVFLLVWVAAKWLRRTWSGHVERPVLTSDGFRQCGVHVDFATGTITLPRGDSYPVAYVRGLRWKDYSTAGKYRAYIDVGCETSQWHSRGADDMIHWQRHHRRAPVCSNNRGQQQ